MLTDHSPPQVRVFTDSRPSAISVTNGLEALIAASTGCGFSGGPPIAVTIMWPLISQVSQIESH